MIVDPTQPDARFADHWDASWAVADPGSYAVLARTRFTLEAAPHAARGWVAAAGLWASHPLGFHSAATQPPFCILTVNGLISDPSQRLLLRGEAVPVDLASALVEGSNEISIEATYYDLPTMVGLALPVCVAVLFQADLEVPGEPLLRLATGERQSLMRVMPTRPAVTSSTWEVFVRRTAEGPWDKRSGVFLHPLAASPLLRLPRRGGRLEQAADEELPAFRHTHRPAPAPITLAPDAVTVVDFGEELVGHLTVRSDAPLRLTLGPGESAPEARDFDDRTENPLRVAALFDQGTWRDARRAALRHVAVRNDSGAPATFDLGLDAFEIAIEQRGAFRCADALLEEVYGRRAARSCAARTTTSRTGRSAIACSGSAISRRRPTSSVSRSAICGRCGDRSCSPRRRSFATAPSPASARIRTISSWPTTSRSGFSPRAPTRCTRATSTPRGS